MYDIIELNSKLVSELKEISQELNIPDVEGLKKQDLIYKILDYQALSDSTSAPVKEVKKKNIPPKKKEPVSKKVPVKGVKSNEEEVKSIEKVVSEEENEKKTRRRRLKKPVSSSDSTKRIPREDRIKRLLKILLN